MCHRFLPSVCVLAVVIAVGFWAPASAVAQAQTGATTTAGADAFRTPWGDPDLQGIWANDTSTPLQRPSRFAGTAVLSDEELAEYTLERQQSRENRDRRDQSPGTVTDVGRAYNAHWFPVPGNPLSRTSLIVDPPDGKVPPFTPEALERFTAWARTKGRTGTAASPLGRPEGLVDGTEGGVDGRGQRADHPEDRRLSERCLLWGTGLPRLPGGYNNHFQIVQSPDHVVILIEMIHDPRIIPLDDRPHLPQDVRQWLGDSRGHWEGETLVVETTNFSNKTHFRGSFDGLHLVERFTRVDADTIDYEFTVEDPTTWTRPWSVAYPFRSLQSLVGGVDQIQIPQIYEFACHEGNYGLTGQLAGARALERLAAQAATTR